jgi:hypothetical protein
MQGILYEEPSFWLFALVTVLLGGWAAWMTGRAFALTWRSPGQAVASLLLLAGAVRFIHYALFEGTLLSLRYYLVDAVVVIAIGLIGYRYTRARQMTTQYRWLYERTGPLSWRAKAGLDEPETLPDCGHQMRRDFRHEIRKSVPDGVLRRSGRQEPDTRNHQRSDFMKKLLLTGVALGLGLALSGAANAQIKIGVAGPITGPNAAFGAQLKNGAEQAVEDINAAGGINGQKLQIVVGDDVSDPKQGVSVANKFVSEGVKMVVGHFNSGVSIPASEVYQEAGIIQITPASTNEGSPSATVENVPHLRPDDQQGASPALLARTSRKKVAVIHDRPLRQGPRDTPEAP